MFFFLLNNDSDTRLEVDFKSNSTPQKLACKMRFAYHLYIMRLSNP